MVFYGNMDDRRKVRSENDRVKCMIDNYVSGDDITKHTCV